MKPMPAPNPAFDFRPRLTSRRVTEAGGHSVVSRTSVPARSAAEDADENECALLHLISLGDGVSGNGEDASNRIRISYVELRSR